MDRLLPASRSGLPEKIPIHCYPHVLADNAVMNSGNQHVVPSHLLSRWGQPVRPAGLYFLSYLFYQ
ncbi:hypothetical protein CUJ86_04260 [Methanofollis fontis]|uniref:Uncharacterized protein n=1 Tax=Methanofollis fontis TaxID=2052832 RepID=A0A483CY88_9EURY|nr:hypothetical protein CUJ86_04260 [Methanofollis fontis]